MKKWILCLLIIAMALSLAACGAPADTTDKTAQSAAAADVDLTQLSSTMVYSEVYNMMTAPSKYAGKTVKMSGTLSVYEDENTGNTYYSVVIADAAACCAQGLEFVLADEGDGYPKAGTVLTVVGEFSTYEEYGNTYGRLKGASIV